jgi:hypothetical protein
MLKQIVAVKDAVEEVLREDKFSRDSDMHLILEVWKREGLEVTEEQEKFIKNVCSPTESITRVRRRLQEEGYYKASPAIKAEREAQQQNVRQHFSKQGSLL